MPLRDLIGDKYSLSPRVRTLREVLNMIRPEPIREPLPPLRSYEPLGSTHLIKRPRSQAG
jgi:hypothetical protein